MPETLTQVFARLNITPYTNLHTLSDDAFRELRIATMSDNALIRCCGSIDQFASIKATLRLRRTLHREEVAIKRLTKWLVGMTAVLIVLTAVLVWLTVLVLQHGA